MRRRVLFATPFVMIAACKRPIETPIKRDEAVTEPEPPVRRVARLVAELPPLEPDREVEPCDERRGDHCNPPRPQLLRPRPPDPVEAIHAEVTAVRRDAAGSTVRAARRSQRIDRSWRIVFVTRRDVEVAGGECRIVDANRSEIDCSTSLAPEQLLDDDDRLGRLRFEPPADLVAKIAYERDNWVEPPPGWRGPVPLPPMDPRLRIMGKELKDKRLLLTISKGRDDGVYEAWTAMVIKADGTAVPGGACEIVKIEKALTVCATTAHVERVVAAGYVRLVQPSR